MGRPRRRNIVGPLLLLATIAPVSGCKTTVRDFVSLDDSAAFNRARATGLDDEASDAVAIPALIAHLEDADAVVRLTSHESLRERTGRDFGYIPYGTPGERAAAVARWRSWWESQAVTPSGRRLPPGPGR
ncbi:hypothetical protein [Tautonia plasticadhaerens]|uniref:Uncharacterized protein n=1 Tax=Tautonia plasticadhaerens TaxID=2527974 RepID=A0A518H3S0_9BACT|nr:hypothetical protein [Tautonia plasticadhaerens]QDV35452.1 hypothetical protein ElP_33550 [Tautonia plasticadhaerens]